MDKSSSIDYEDWRKVEGPQDQESPEKNSKLKRIDYELQKCMGSVSSGLEHEILKSYSCAWQKDILVQGHLYLTQNWICFYSNILGWETKTCIPLKDVTAICKQRTARVFPNAILVEAGDKKYGFSSFVHRDRTYQVMHLIWHNSHLPEPSTGDDLRKQLKCHRSKHHKHSPGLSRRHSFTGETSELLSSPCSSLRAASQSFSVSTTPTSKAATGGVNTRDLTRHQKSSDPLREEVDGIMYETHNQQALEASTSSSIGSLDAETDSSSFSLHTSTECGRDSTSSLDSVGNPPQKVIPVALTGGSPNFLHHWKQTLNSSMVFHRMTSLARPQHLVQICSPARLINVLIILFILLLLLSTVMMICQLCRVEPSLQPYLYWQPWCSCRTQ